MDVLTDVRSTSNYRGVKLMNPSSASTIGGIDWRSGGMFWREEARVSQESRQ